MYELRLLDPPATNPLVDRFWRKVDRNGPLSIRRGAPGRCWAWTASLRTDGYGQFMVTEGGTKRNVRAHRLAYELSIGPIPEGLVLDHLCRNRFCVNPAHLEAVTQRINSLRGVGICAIAARKTHCPKGHPYNAVNTHRRPDGRRLCRACQKVWDAARYARNRQQFLATRPPL